MTAAALDTRVSEEEQPTETRLWKFIAQINIWLLFCEFSEECLDAKPVIFNPFFWEVGAYSM